MIVFASIGFAIELMVARDKPFPLPTRFSLKTLFVAFYIVAVLTYVVRGLLIIRAL